MIRLSTVKDFSCGCANSASLWTATTPTVKQFHIQDGETKSGRGPRDQPQSRPCLVSQGYGPEDRTAMQVKRQFAHAGIVLGSTVLRSISTQAVNPGVESLRWRYGQGCSRLWEKRAVQSCGVLYPSCQIWCRVTRLAARPGLLKIGIKGQYSLAGFLYPSCQSWCQVTSVAVRPGLFKIGGDRSTTLPPLAMTSWLAGKAVPSSGHFELATKCVGIFCFVALVWATG